MDELASMLQLAVRIEETPYDVLLVSGDEIREGVKAHRDVLSKCSCYFRTLFELVKIEDPIESPTVIFVPTVSTECLKSIVKYCYTGNFEDIDGNVLEMLSGAAFLQIESLSAECKQVILACLGKANWVVIYRFAKNHFTDLAEEVTQFVSDNILELIDENNIYELNLVEFVEIISIHGLTVLPKETCSEVFLRWLKHDPGERVSNAMSKLTTIPTDVAVHLQNALQQLLE